MSDYTLYEIDSRLFEIKRKLADVDEEGPEFEELTKAWEALDEQRDNKLSAYCSLYKELDAYQGRVEAEGKRLIEKAKKLERRSNHLKDFLQGQLRPGEKFETVEHAIKWRASERVIVTDADSPIPSQYLKPQPPKIDKALIKKDLQAGASLSFAKLEQRINMRIE